MHDYEHDFLTFDQELKYTTIKQKTAGMSHTEPVLLLRPRLGNAN